MGGRFLECLEKDVRGDGRAVAHAVGIEDDGDLDRRNQRAQVQFAGQLARLLGRDLARFRLRPDGVEIGMLVRRGVEHLPGQPERELLERLRMIAGEEVGMPQPPHLDGAGEALAKFFGAEGHGRAIREFNRVSSFPSESGQLI